MIWQYTIYDSIEPNEFADSSSLTNYYVAPTVSITLFDLVTNRDFKEKMFNK